MVESINNSGEQCVIIFGSPGKGKSTLLNFLKSGEPVGTFITGRSAKSVTKVVSNLTFPIFGSGDSTTYRFFDLPGVGDPTIPITVWAKDLYSALGTSKIGMVCFMVHADDRVDNAAVTLGILMQTFIQGIKWEKVCLIFGFVNKSDGFDDIYAKEWIDEFNTQSQTQISHAILFRNDVTVCRDFEKILKIHIGSGLMRVNQVPNIEKALAKIIEVVDPETAKKNSQQLEILKSEKQDAISAAKKAEAIAQAAQSKNPMVAQTAELAQSSGGCFALNSLVQTVEGIKKIVELQVGDIVQTQNNAYDKVIGFIDHEETVITSFITISTKLGQISLTPKHLIFQKRRDYCGFAFASFIQAHDSIFHHESGWTEVYEVKKSLAIGYSAPLTTSSTIIVDGFYCSCWSSIKSHRIAYLFTRALAPASQLIWKNYTTKQCHPVIEFSKNLTRGWFYKSQNLGLDEVTQ